MTTETEIPTYPKARRKSDPAPALKPVNAPQSDPVQPTTPEAAPVPKTPVKPSQPISFAAIAREADECGAALDACAMLTQKFARPVDLGTMLALQQMAIDRLQSMISCVDDPLTLQEAKVVGGLRWLSGKLNPGRSEICDEICNLVRDADGGAK